ncbi:Maf family protein [Olsenella sp. YH-ols2217]|uniref:dTTP/UTP pyrophosphatase n=1 Tax=Kribbibacterium absianum TaxID=3044210 RepID=A0ABT6ZLU6_9ACTN|nr:MULTISPECIES: Maf family protein [unclassified Olsenella]MDJ1122019.1 Maf family protein [Olsenella sp. YH-ols2216]MDJ1130027.1 Maf family protein [Olsenella sp. YH-ols2217]
MILASQSPRRIDLMKQGGYVCRTIPANIDESAEPDEEPEALVERLATSKALAVMDRADPNEVVVGADTVVWLDGAVLGKPKDHEDAEAMLGRLSGTRHHVSTGVCLAVKDGHGRVSTHSFVDTADVEFYPLEPQEVWSYAQSEEPMDKAGAYAIQGQGRLFVKGIRGNYDTVVGLPIARVARELRTFINGL